MSGVIGLLIVVGLIAGIRTCSRSDSTATNATLAYWSNLKRITAMADANGSDPARAVALYRQAADQIEALPIKGVDAEVVQLGANMTIVMRRVATLVERSNSPGLFIEAFMRGMNGDPLGTANEQAQAVREVEQQVRLVQEQATRLRATLIARYGMDFPPM